MTNVPAVGASGAHYPHAELAKTILRRFFADPDRNLVVDASMTEVPVVLANAGRSTRSFAAGQRLYVYNGYWGMNERVQVVGRFRQRHRFVRGVFPIAGLTNCRPHLVHHPGVIRRLAGEIVESQLFIGIGALGVCFVPSDGYRTFQDVHRALMSGPPESHHG
jgi:hypothetical protein